VWHGLGRSKQKVSILVFVELALDGYIHILHGFSQTMFQSLFSWNLLLMVATLAGDQALDLDVSILVFVELALDDYL